SSVIDKFADKFFAKYNPLPSHRHALYAMKECRQHHSPYMIAQCTNDQCRHSTYVPHSCGHRNCPHCQNHESQRWIETQLNKQLPAQYYLLTFTLPQQLRELAWQNQRQIFTILFAVIS
ncbi:MAG TPA: IS91 family transposase, partial [Desulfobacterales bacterium]|nr:IS91 family transposase [Desulfobacterales bacterium]